MKKNNEGKLVIIMIIALIAFGIGVAVGVNTAIHGIDTPTNNTTVKNVTNEMMGHEDSSHNVTDNNLNYINSYNLLEVNKCIK